MTFNKIVKNGYIVSIGKNIIGENITEEEYNNLMSYIKSSPQETDLIGYRLTESLTWESYEKEQQSGSDPDAEELLSIIVGDSYE